MTENNDSILNAITIHGIQHGNVGTLDFDEHSAMYINWRRAVDTCSVFSSFWKNIDQEAYDSCCEELMQN